MHRLVVADVVAEVVVQRGGDRRQPDRVDAEPGQVVEPARDPVRVADAVPIRVLERAGIDLVEDGVPLRRRAGAGVHEADGSGGRASGTRRPGAGRPGGGLRMTGHQPRGSSSRESAPSGSASGPIPSRNATTISSMRASWTTG